MTYIILLMEHPFQRTPIPAMARARDGLATRTGSRVLTVSFHYSTVVRLENTAKRHIAEIGEEVCVRSDLSSIPARVPQVHQSCVRTDLSTVRHQLSDCTRCGESLAGTLRAHQSLREVSLQRGKGVPPQRSSPAETARSRIGLALFF
jgi:hypothetical protein